MKRLPMVISEAIFFTLYILIKTIVLVGEITQGIFTLPGKINYTKLKLPKITIKSLENYTKIPDIEPEKPAEPSKEETEQTKETFTKVAKQAKEVLEKSAGKTKEILKMTAVSSAAFLKLVNSKTSSAAKKTFQFIKYSVIPFVLRVWNKLISIVKAIVRFITSYRIGYYVLGLVTCFLIVFAWQSYEFVKQLPSPKNIGKLNYPVTTQILDKNGKLLYEIYRDQNRTPVKLTTLPKYISQATISTEDKEFYSHHGISIVGGMLRAVKDTYISNELQGGSTITQQLVKSALLSPDRTIERKVKEIILAVWTENLYTKDQILEMYLNQVPYGGSAYGIEEASKTYFGKSASKLTIGEAAMLAGMTRAPSLYSPYVNPERAKQRRNEVLNRMLQEKYITEEQYKIETAKTLVVNPPKVNIQAPHFVFYTKQKLEEQYGPSVVEEGGLRVTTTLDLDVQKEAEKILQEEITKVANLNVTNGAILVTKPATGEIVAMVGSVDY
jgi:membrane peptidoglycan carboxypeptidase